MSEEEQLIDGAVQSTNGITKCSVATLILTWYLESVRLQVYFN